MNLIFIVSNYKCPNQLQFKKNVAAVLVGNNFSIYSKLDKKEQSAVSSEQITALFLMRTFNMKLKLTGKHHLAAESNK